MNGEVTLLDEYVYNEQKMFEKEPMFIQTLLFKNYLQYILKCDKLLLVKHLTPVGQVSHSIV